MNNQPQSRSVRPVPTRGKAKSIPVGWSSETRFSIPIPHNEVERIAALHNYQILDTPSESEFDDITMMAAQVCNAPMATISFVDKNRQWFKSKIGVDLSETPRDIAFCAHAIMHRDVFVLPDASVDPRFSKNPMVTGEPRIRFYAGVPLVTENDEALGTLCVLDRVPRNLTTRQKSALVALSRLVLQRLEQRKQAIEVDHLRQEMAKCRKNRSLLESSLDSFEEGICITEDKNSDHDVVSCNIAFAKMLGCTKEQVSKRPLSSFFQDLLPKFQHALASFKDPANSSMPIPLSLTGLSSQKVRAQISSLKSPGKVTSHFLWRFPSAGTSQKNKSKK